MSDGQLSESVENSWKGSPKLGVKRQRSTMSTDDRETLIVVKQVKEKKKEEKLIQAEGMETGKVINYYLKQKCKIYVINSRSTREFQISKTNHS
jgi:hypothetical protein